MTNMDVQSMPPSFRVFTCGAFLVERWDRAAYQSVRVGEWGGSQDPRRLLKKLACSPGRRARRGEILEALWPDIDPKEAGGYLNDAAYKLRTVLQPSKEQRKQTLLHTAEDANSFSLPGQEVLWIDADTALALLEQAEDAERTGADPLSLIEQAATCLTRGTFLEEEEGLWAYGRRASLELARHECLLWRAALYQQRGQVRKAETLLLELLEENPTDEDALYRLVELLQRQHRYGTALRFYRNAERLLAAEGIVPTAWIRDLVEHVHTDLPLATREPVPLHQRAAALPTLHQGNTLDGMQTHRHRLHDLLHLACTVLVLSPYARWYPDEHEQPGRAVAPLTRLDLAVLDDLESITASYWRLCTNTSLDLLGGVLEHFQAVVHLLKRVQPREAFRRLCSLAGENAQILGKTLFDLHEYALSWAYYTFSIKAAQGASNHDLWATGLGRMSLLLIYWEQPQESLPLLQEAHQLTIQSARIRCWLAAVEAEVYAHLDDANACDEALRTAKALTACEPLGEDSYSTGFNPSRLAGYEGACFVRLHRPDRALPALQQALALLDPQAIRRQSTLFTDIGIAHAQQGNVQEACKLACQALAITTNTKSRAVLERVLILRKALEPWRETEEVKDLEKQLGATLTLITPGEAS
jgi:DNA-binding SARP family transcriptional activator